MMIFKDRKLLLSHFTIVAKFSITSALCSITILGDTHNVGSKILLYDTPYSILKLYNKLRSNFYEHVTKLGQR